MTQGGKITWKEILVKKVNFHKIINGDLKIKISKMRLDFGSGVFIRCCTNVGMNTTTVPSSVWVIQILDEFVLW